MTARGKRGGVAREALSVSLRRLNARHPWSHNDWFHGWVLANLPDRCSVALDVGCGPVDGSWPSGSPGR